MKTSWIAVLGLIMCASVWAQEPTPADQPPAETPPAEQPPADASTPPADASTPPADASTPPAEQPPADQSASTPPAETPPAEAPPAEQAAKEPWGIYVGANYSKIKVSTSNSGSLGTNDYHGKFLDARVGKRLFEAVGLEFHYGLDLADSNTGEIATDRYYGLFVVPTATLFETLELSFPVGYGHGEYSLGGLSSKTNSVGYGFNAELPLKQFGDTMPDLRLVAGWMIYNQTSAARIYGPSFGLRYDFKVPAPF